ncbi:MAG: N,N-dimethylformamidase beta subunit family domain-containing protein, partial [Gaiellaceae bacterium]
IANTSPIALENQLPGNPASEWNVIGRGDLTIVGFATDMSVNRCSTQYFKVNTDAPAFHIDIYRMGYYQGNGARKVATVPGTPSSQPDCITDPLTGLIDCGNWSVSAAWNVPANAVSGMYFAKVTREDTQGASHIPFVVRDDSSTSDLLVQTSDPTWQAYNDYGGSSLYLGNAPFPGGHAAKVSYNRPFTNHGTNNSDNWFMAEYPMTRFLESNGYDVSYMCGIDTDRHGDLITRHRAFVEVGHDEYWSGGQRANVTAARDAGTHLAFFSGNEVYWKTRYEPSIDGSNTPFRTLVCYKEGTLGERACGGRCDPDPGVWTGLWRDGCGSSYPANDGCRPENELTGTLSWTGSSGVIEVPSAYRSMRVWRNTSIAALQPGQTVSLGLWTLGFEWDPEQPSDA